LEVLVTLTTDVGRILSKLHNVQPKGVSNFLTGIKVAHVSASNLNIIPKAKILSNQRNVKII